MKSECQSNIFLAISYQAWPWLHQPRPIPTICSDEHWILNIFYQAGPGLHQPRPTPTFCCDEAGRWGKVKSDLFIYFVCRLSSLISSIGMRWWEKKFWTKGENNFAARELDVLPDLVMSGALQHLDHLHVDYTRWDQEFWIYNISYMHQIAFLL